MLTGTAGEYQNDECESSLSGHGHYNWLPGPGEKPGFAGRFSAVTLESVGGSKITCQGGTSHGEYRGARTETVTITLTGCQEAASHHACQSTGAAAGEVVTGEVEGEVGYITGGAKPSVGLDAKAEPNLATFECGTDVVSLEGSVIGPVKPSQLDKMASAFTLGYQAAAGKQLPEQFEGGAKDTLTTTITAGLETSSEQSGLTSTDKVSNEERLEIKARP